MSGQTGYSYDNERTNTSRRWPWGGDLRVTAVAMPDMPPLSAKYGLSPEQTTFFKAQTGIDDDEELKNHILELQERAYKVTRVHDRQIR